MRLRTRGLTELGILKNKLEQGRSNQWLSDRSSHPPQVKAERLGLSSVRLRLSWSSKAVSELGHTTVRGARHSGNAIKQADIPEEA